ncbi:MAG: hypothetical protein ACYDA2_10085, partial [Acidimicrobiales bacterium]
LAPVIPGFQAPVEYPAPPGALAGLEAQPELSEVLAQGGFSVFVDDLALPEWASHPLPVSTGAAPNLVSWTPALTGSASATAVTGSVPGDSALVVGRAPAADWVLVPASGPARLPSVALGYGARFDVATGGRVVVRYTGSWLHAVEIGIETLVVVALAAALAGRRRWLDWWYGPLRRRWER